VAELTSGPLALLHHYLRLDREPIASPPVILSAGLRERGSAMVDGPMDS
jgi:hypothetical protein